MSNVTTPSAGNVTWFMALRLNTLGSWPCGCKALENRSKEIDACGRDMEPGGLELRPLSAAEAGDSEELVSKSRMPLGTAWVFRV